jgi:RNA-binding protein
MPAQQLTPAQRAELRSRAHALHPLVMVGGDGLTRAVLLEIDRSLSAHDLIKIRVFGDDREARIAIYEAICDELNAAPVQHIGKLLVVWRSGSPVLRENRDNHANTATEAIRGAGIRTVKVRKPSSGAVRRPKPTKVTVLGNERVTQGGNVKRAKARPVSQKKKALS